MASGPETKLVEKMRKAAIKEYGSDIEIVKYHGSQYTRAGVHDLLVCLHGVFIAVEVKAPESYGGSVEKALAVGPTMKQVSFGERIVAAGGVAACAATVEQFMEILWNAHCYAEEQTDDTGVRYF